jgi:hypothetical protein
MPNIKILQNRTKNVPIPNQMESRSPNPRDEMWWLIFFRPPSRRDNWTWHQGQPCSHTATSGCTSPDLSCSTVKGWALDVTPPSSPIFLMHTDGWCTASPPPGPWTLHHPSARWIRVPHHFSVRHSPSSWRTPKRHHGWTHQWSRADKAPTCASAMRPAGTAIASSRRQNHLMASTRRWAFEHRSASSHSPSHTQIWIFQRENRKVPLEFDRGGGGCSMSDRCESSIMIGQLMFFQIRRRRVVGHRPTRACNTLKGVGPNATCESALSNFSSTASPQNDLGPP